MLGCQFSRLERARLFQRNRADVATRFMIGRNWSESLYMVDTSQRVTRSQRYDLSVLIFPRILRFWQVPACEARRRMALIPRPGATFFEAVMQAVPDLKICGRDLGDITPDVTESWLLLAFQA